jgi:hypothetical protein
MASTLLRNWDNEKIVPKSHVSRISCIRPGGVCVLSPMIRPATYGFNLVHP